MNIVSQGFEFTVSALPEATIQALLQRGLNHVLGNEAAARVSRFKADSPDATDEEVSAMVAKVRGELVDKIKGGTLGVRVSRGTSIDPVEAEMERLAKEEINGILKANGLVFKGKGDERCVTFADGSTKTMDDMLDKRLADHGERLRKEAEKVVKAKAKAQEKAKAAKANATVDTLGL